MGEIILKYKVINIEEITKEALEKMLEEAYNDGYNDGYKIAKEFYTKPLNGYSNMPINNNIIYKNEGHKVEDWCKNLQAQKDY